MINQIIKMITSFLGVVTFFLDKYKIKFFFTVYYVRTSTILIILATFRIVFFLWFGFDILSYFIGVDDLYIGGTYSNDIKYLLENMTLEENQDPDNPNNVFANGKKDGFLLNYGLTFCVLISICFVVTVFSK